MAPLCASLPLGPAASEEVKEPPREIRFQSQGVIGLRSYQLVGERGLPWATQGSLRWSLEKQLEPGAFITEEIAWAKKSSGRRGGGWGRLGRGGEHHAVCILGHTANAPGARPGRDGEPRCRGGRAQGQAAPEAR